MSVPGLRRIVSASCVAVAAVGLAVAGATAASADGVLSQWYPTYLDCQTAGNVYAQQGLIHSFSCDTGNGGWILTGW